MKDVKAYLSLQMTDEDQSMALGSEASVTESFWQLLMRADQRQGLSRLWKGLSIQQLLPLL